MKAKEYLQQLQRLDVLITQKIEELDDLHLKSRSISGVDYSKENVQTSFSGNAPFVEIIERIADIEAEINNEIDKFVNSKHKIINQIQGLRSCIYIEILYKRYVQFKCLEEIAEEMNFAYQYIRELHGCALKEFEKTYKNLQNLIANLH